MTHMAESSDDILYTLKSSCQHSVENGAKRAVNFRLMISAPTPDCLKLALAKCTDWVPGCCCQQGGQGRSAPFPLGVVPLIWVSCVCGRDPLPATACLVPIVHTEGLCLQTC